VGARTAIRSNCERYLQEIERITITADQVSFLQVDDQSPQLTITRLVHLLPIVRYRNYSLCARDASAIARIGVLEIMLNGEQHNARAAESDALIK
jgi:hypothetical protein